MPSSGSRGPLLGPKGVAAGHIGSEGAYARPYAGSSRANVHRSLCLTSLISTSPPARPFASEVP
eukprot:1704843-Pyramimonas_sp.AAC.1